VPGDDPQLVAMDKRSFYAVQRVYFGKTAVTSCRAI
jgi:hypothetical protein